MVIVGAGVLKRDDRDALLQKVGQWVAWCGTVTWSGVVR